MGFNSVLKGVQNIGNRLNKFKIIVNKFIYVINLLHNFTLCHQIWCTTLRHVIKFGAQLYVVIKFGTQLQVMSSNLVHNFKLCHQILCTTLRYVI